MKVYFLTYGDKNYNYSKIHLSYLAKVSGFYDEIITLGRRDLSTEFKKTFQDVLTYPRGGGYWVWKHEIIKQLLTKINYGDVILYCDAGSTINNLEIAKNRFNEYLEIINDANVSSLRFETEKQYIENQFTSLEVFNALDVDINSDIGKTTQLQAGVMFFKKEKGTIDLLSDYRELLLKDSNLITDHYLKNQSTSFIENRHDQSIFSILGKKYNSYILDNETEFRNRKELQYEYPILTVRASNHGVKDKFKLLFLKKFYGAKTRYF